jgi:deazaflavin-dependent oxidoreductase (nitroreductase family)
MMKELAGDAHISFEGGFHGLRLLSTPGVSREETPAVKRKTLWPKPNFVVLPSKIGQYYVRFLFAMPEYASEKSVARVAVSLAHEMKHQVVHLLQKYVLNPPIKLLFALGIVPPGYALLETVGRKTGKPRRTPVGNGLVGEQFWIVAEHGRKSGYVRNIASNPRVRIKVRVGLRARWYAGTASLLSDDDPRERQRWLYRQVPSSVMNSAAVRFFGTQLLTVRVDLDSQ